MTETKAPSQGASGVRKPPKQSCGGDPALLVHNLDTNSCSHSYLARSRRHVTYQTNKLKAPKYLHNKEGTRTMSMFFRHPPSPQHGKNRARLVIHKGGTATKEMPTELSVPALPLQSTMSTADTSLFGVMQWSACSDLKVFARLGQCSHPLVRPVLLVKHLEGRDCQPRHRRHRHLQDTGA